MIAVLGANGQLGSAFVRALGDSCLPVTRARLDLIEVDAIEPWLNSVRPALVINCAAYTDVDAAEIGTRTGVETRSIVLGHLQRGGTPTAYDRLISLRFGAAAVRMVEAGRFGTMVALHPPEVRAVPLEEAIAQIKRVPTTGDIVLTARDMGISFGD